MKVAAHITIVDACETCGKTFNLLAAIPVVGDLPSAPSCCGAPMAREVHYQDKSLREIFRDPGERSGDVGEHLAEWSKFLRHGPKG